MKAIGSKLFYSKLRVHFDEQEQITIDDPHAITPNTIRGNDTTIHRPIVRAVFSVSSPR